MVAAPGRLVGALAAIVLACAFVPIGWPTTPSMAPEAALVAMSPSADTVKYYIVGPPHSGQQEYLFEIAAKTLGSGKRYPEIFALNQGRPQADGGRLEDPALLRTGWILILPDDATGPDVHVGPLPTLLAPRSASDAPATTEPTVSADLLAGPAPVQRWRETAVRVGALVACVTLVALAMRVLRGGRVRLAGNPAPTGAAVMAPPRQLRLSHIRSLRSAVGKPRQPAPPISPRQPVPPVSPRQPKPRREPKSPVPPPQPTSLVPPGQRGSAIPPRPDPAGSPRPDPTTPTPSGQWTPVAVESRHRRAPYEVRVQHGDDVVRVRLVGASEGLAYVWLAPIHEPPVESMAIYVGGSSAGSLYLCLAAAPDVLTITGEPGARRRLSRAIAEQFAAAGHLVTEVGDAGWPLPPLGVRFFEELDAMSAASSELATVDGPQSHRSEMIILHAEHAKDLASLRALSNGDSGDRILVAVGDLPPARWSVDVRRAAWNDTQAHAHRATG